MRYRSEIDEKDQKELSENQALNCRFLSYPQATPQFWRDLTSILAWYTLKKGAIQSQFWRVLAQNLKS